MKSSELVLKEDGSIYHLNLKPGDLAETIITVGDPARVLQVSQFFDTIELERNNREIVTHTGTYKGKRISVISTGMGTDNIDIVLTEIDALFNIDFDLGAPKSTLKQVDIIRIGTSGTIQKDIAVHDVVMSTYAVGIDGLLFTYSDSKKVRDLELEDQINQKVCIKEIPIYAVESSSKIQKQLHDLNFIEGITLTAGGFYGAQAREIRLQSALHDYIPKLAEFSYKGVPFTNIEMESSGLFGMASLLGHHAISVNLILANRVTGEFSKEYHAAMDELILKVLNQLTQ